ncbi:hypothetical protein BV25DRAFT_1207007 [Artomyces pyxidatus]|uniref:Uncharacterized protein n=1 Tax=Artomyces pyxidatus TaxID=48021 RepID=A0ACB8SQZ1_9AGAM|nr:hypothetical protein BV25DRAFT_1207007 [Artomyces pyxidatus]
MIPEFPKADGYARCSRRLCPNLPSSLPRLLDTNVWTPLERGKRTTARHHGRSPFDVLGGECAS